LLQAALKLIPVLLCPGLHQACCAPVHHQQCLHHLINHLTPLPFCALRAREVRYEGGKYIIYVLPLRLGECRLVRGRQRRTRRVSHSVVGLGVHPPGHRLHQAIKGYDQPLYTPTPALGALALAHDVAQISQRPRGPDL
tara:strand:- start:587 stop:1003 length:417 start_codon:yes stop_codon:yes gene_type:complete